MPVDDPTAPVTEVDSGASGLEASRPVPTPGPRPTPPGSGSAPRRVVARRVVLRRVDPWTVLRASVLFYGCLLVVGLVAGLLLWLIGSATGVVDNTEDVIAELFALDSFRFEPLVMLLFGVLGGVVLVMLGTVVNALLAVVYNLIAEVVGGVEVTEEVADQPRRTRI